MGVINMDLLQEATLDRLWTKYESRFGHPPPIGVAGFEETIAVLRKGLAEHVPKPCETVSVPKTFGA